MVIGAAVVLFIASFLDYFDYGSTSVDAPNSWDSLGNGIGVYMVGVIGAALIVLSRSQPQPRKVLGLDLAAFGVAATVFTAWNMFWTIIDLGQIDAGAGLILGLIASLALAGGAVATSLVPALQAPLSGAPKPQAVHPPYGGQPGQGYGYPGGQQPSYGGQQPGQPQPYGAQQPGQPEAQQQAPAPAPAQQQAPAPAAGDFTPFWFAVPVARQLYGEDGSASPIAELAPGTWYLAVEQRGAALIAQTQDGRRGVLQDTTGIQRG